MKDQLKLRIVLETPPAGVDYALQKGKGNDFTVIERQKSTGKNLVFEFEVELQFKNDAPVFLGPFAQGTPADRFVYIGIGKYAGQPAALWDRRLKVPLTSIDAATARKTIEKKQLLETTVPGTDKNGTPTCATVKPFGGWRIAK